MKLGEPILKILGKTYPQLVMTAKLLKTIGNIKGKHLKACIFAFKISLSGSIFDNKRTILNLKHSTNELIF